VKGLIFVSIFIASLFAADFEWRGYEDGLKEAQKLKRPIMVMISQKGCITCDYMEDVAFEDEKLAEYIENFWVPVKMEIKEAIKRGFKAYGTPTFYFLNHKGEKISRAVAGGANAKVFLNKLKEVKNAL